MRRGKRAWRAMAGIGIATLAVASAITAVQTVGPEGGATAYGAPAPRAKQLAGGRARVCGHAARIREEPGPDRCARALLRARQPLRVLRDARRADALADEGQAGRATGAGAALRRPQPPAAPAGAKRAPGKVNYLRGKNSSKWQTQLARYQDIVYRDLWPNIDLRLHQKAGVAEVRVPRPSGCPHRGHPPGLRGRDRTWRSTPRAPCASRPASASCATRRPCPTSGSPASASPCTSRYVLERGGKAPRFAFAVGAYRHDRELVIDPGIQFTTFLGGGGNEIGAGIARRCRRQLVHRRHDAVARLPDDGRRVQAHRRGQQLRGRVRHEAEPARHRARLLDVRRRQQHGVRATASRSTAPATPTSPARRSRRTSRPRAARSTARATSRRTARAAAPTTPTASSSSSTRAARR